MLTNYSNLSDKDKKKFEQSIKAMYRILGLAVIFFYVLPFACMFTGNLAQVLVPMILLNINTIFVFIACLIHSKKYNFSVLIPVALAIFYIPTVIILYRDFHYMMFAAIYLVLGLFGEFTGYLFLKRKYNKRQPFGLNRLVNGKKEKKAKPQKNKAAKGNKKNK